jgi:hypothetical protein
MEASPRIKKALPALAKSGIQWNEILRSRAPGAASAGVLAGVAVIPKAKFLVSVPMLPRSNAIRRKLLRGRFKGEPHALVLCKEFAD